MTNIMQAAFEGCTALVSVEIGSNVREIGALAFSGDVMLRGIVIPATVDVIGANCFAGCDNLMIYAQPVSSPSGWAPSWNGEAPTYWDSITTIPEANLEFLTKESAARKYLPIDVADAKFLSRAMAYAEFLTNYRAEEVYAKKSDLSTIYKFKGTVTDYSDLPSNAEIGDVYNVLTPYGSHGPGTNYAWDGTTWDALGGSFDFSFENIENDINALYTYCDQLSARVTSLETDMGDINTALDSIIAIQNAILGGA